MNSSQTLKCLIAAHVLGLVAVVPPVHSAELTVACVRACEMQADPEYAGNSILIEATLPATLAGARIDRALLLLPLAADSLGREQVITVSPSGKAWNSEAQLKAYEDLLSVDSLSVSQFVSGAIGDDVALDVTPIVSSWVAGEIPNLGFVVTGLKGLGYDIRLTRDVSQTETAPFELRILFTKRDSKY